MYPISRIPLGGFVPSCLANNSGRCDERKTAPPENSVAGVIQRQNVGHSRSSKAPLTQELFLLRGFRTNLFGSFLSPRSFIRVLIFRTQHFAFRIFMPSGVRNRIFVNSNIYYALFNSSLPFSSIIAILPCTSKL